MASLRTKGSLFPFERALFCADESFSYHFLFTLMQFSKENPLELDFPIIKLQDHEDVTEEAVLTSLRRAISRISTLQAHDGHWPGDYGGPMFLLPGLVFAHICG